MSGIVGDAEHARELVADGGGFLGLGPWIALRIEQLVDPGHQLAEWMQPGELRRAGEELQELAGTCHRSVYPLVSDPGVLDEREMELAQRVRQRGQLPFHRRHDRSIQRAGLR